MYTAYVGSSLQILTYGLIEALGPAPPAHFVVQIVLRRLTFCFIAMSLVGTSDIHHV